MSYQPHRKCLVNAGFFPIYTRYLPSGLTRPSLAIFSERYDRHRATRCTVRSFHARVCLRNDNIPFDSPSKPASDNGLSQRSTLTDFERDVIERLKRGQLGRRVDEEELSGHEDNYDRADEAYEDLDKIFETVIGLQEAQERRLQEAMERNQELFKDVPYERALAWLGELNKPPVPSWQVTRSGQSEEHRMENDVFGTEDVKNDTENSDAERKASITFHARVQGKMQSANSDADIWEVLETELFSLFRSLCGQTSQNALVSRDSPEIEQNTELVNAQSKHQSSGTSIEGNVPQSEVSTTSTDRSSTDGRLSLLRDNYAYFLALALRLWQRSYPASPYILQLLPQVKVLGKLSRELGMSTNVYDQVLSVMWTQHRDLHGIADLLQDMLENDLRLSRSTVSQLHDIREARRKDLAQSEDTVSDRWWRMRSVQEAWARVYKLIRQFEDIDVSSAEANTAQSDVLEGAESRDSGLYWEDVDESGREGKENNEDGESKANWKVG